MNKAMSGLPFLISNILAGFVKNQDARHKLRGAVNCFLYTPSMERFIKKQFGEKTNTVKYVRQHTPSRCVCVINNKYFIKIFKHDMRTQRLGVC